jgi:glucose/arabinose dehydrogenase
VSRRSPVRIAASALAKSLAAACLVAACSSTASPSIPAPTATAGGTAATTAPSVGAPSAGPTVASSVAPFVAANVQVLPEAVAKIHGSALAIAAPDDQSSRLFVATQEGQIWSVGPGPAHDLALMLDISKQITSGGERGLLGLALHPGFSSDSRAFVNYTDLHGDTVIASFSIATGNPDRFDPASERAILRQAQPFSNHNGGGIEFGPDGDLYIGLGDGGSGGDPNGNGQNLGTFLAKLLRIDVDHPYRGQAYAVPEDNPFVGRTGAKPEIWLYGLRNPFRFSFDRASGDLWIGDVGQGAWEEVDVVRRNEPGGDDLGWNVMEGNHCYKPADNCDTTAMTRPVSEYGHDQGCAVIGGNVYRGEAYTQLIGGYLFSDSCSGTIWAIPASTTLLVQPAPVGQVSGSPAGFGEDTAGELYIASLDGTIWKLTATSR